MKMFKSLLSIFLSLVLMLQIIVLPSTYGIAADTTNADGNNDKSYEAMLDSIVSENDTYPTEYGVWINELSQECFLSIYKQFK